VNQDCDADNPSIIQTVSRATTDGRRASNTGPPQNNKLRSDDNDDKTTQIIYKDGITPRRRRFCHAQTKRTPGVTDRSTIWPRIAKLPNLFLLLLLLLQLLGTYRRCEASTAVPGLTAG